MHSDSNTNFLFSKLHIFLATTKSSTPSFRGNSYIVIPSPRIPTKDKRKGNTGGPVVSVRPKEMLQISLNFSTIYDDGLLFWNSKRNDRFLGLGLQRGHIQLASTFLDNPQTTVDIPTGGFVADGGWHNIQIEVDIKTILLKLDGRTIFSMNKKIVDLSAIKGGDGVVEDKESTGTMDDLFYIGKYV